ncbi:hypothetical protein LXL04_020227 [Taraxacum kok-saghyz]
MGKKNLHKALAISKDQYDFKIKWHPFLLNPLPSKQGVNKLDYYRSQFGPRVDQMGVRMAEVFKGIRVDFSMEGVTRSTVDTHMLIFLLGKRVTGTFLWNLQGKLD